VISRAEFERALALVRRSGIQDTLQERLHPPGQGGRPRALRLDVLLTAMILTTTHYQDLLLTRVHRLLTNDLARSYQRELGIIRADGQKLTIRQVRYVMEAIERKYAYTGKRRPDLDDPARVERQESFQEVIDQFLAASIPTHLVGQGRFAVDASAIDSAARGKRMPKGTQKERAARKAARAVRTEAENAEADALAAEVNAHTEAGHSYDPDARWGYRTKTFDNKTSMCFGYQLIAFTRVGAVGQESREPLLTDRIVVVAANASMSEPSISALDRFAANGQPVTEVIVDRRFSNYTPDNWAYGLRDRGIEQVLDLSDHDYGATDFNGMPMIAGWPHCPAMPAELEEIRRPQSLTAGALKRSATALERMRHTRQLKEIADFHEKIAAREMYAFVRTSLGQDRSKTGKAKGSEQFMCPAQAGKAVCDNCPLSKYAPTDLPRVPNPPTGPDIPAACKQATISVPMTVSPKLRQRTRWGTPAWVISYNRRSRVEGGFGLLKNDTTGNVKRGWTRQVGIIKTTLLLAVAVTASNLRQLLTWSRATGDVTDPLTLMEVGPVSFEEIDPATGGVGNTGPPTAA
jgi:hypothetical protein